MSFVDSLLSGVVGFATGGPIVGGATFLSGLLSDDGGGRRNAVNLNRDVDVDYLDVLQRRAALDGYTQGFAGGVEQQQSSSGGGQSTQLASTRNAGLKQFANQRGGQNSGGSGAEAQRNLGEQEAGTMPSVNMQEAYRSYLMQGLLGQDTLPGGGAQAAQFQAGLNTIDAQTQRAREQYLQQMSQRGLLRSGMTSTGLAEIESGRAQSLGQLSADLERQRQQQLLQTQQFAAQVMGNQQAQQAQLAAQEPTWGETLGGALGSYAQYEALRNAPQPYGNTFDLGTMMMLSGQTMNPYPPQPAAPTTIGRTMNPYWTPGPATQSVDRPAGPTSTDAGFNPITTTPTRLLGPSTTQMAPLAYPNLYPIMRGETRQMAGPEDMPWRREALID